MISAVDRLRLEGMLGKLGSSHVGERDNAAKLVAQFLRTRGLTWGDVLAGNAGPGLRGNRAGQALHQEPPRVVRTGSVAAGSDAVWRWSMLAGLTVVGAISLTSLLQQTALEQRVTVGAGVVGQCPAGSDTGNWPICQASVPVGSMMASPAVQARSGLAADHRKPAISAFAQGEADRKVADTWHRLAPPGLCSGPFGSGQEDYRSACRMAEKLLSQFDQRRRSDPEYRRGWNSPPT